MDLNKNMNKNFGLLCYFVSRRPKFNLSQEIINLCQFLAVILKE